MHDSDSQFRLPRPGREDLQALPLVSILRLIGKAMVCSLLDGSPQ